MMTLIERLTHYPVKTVVVNGAVQAYCEAGQGHLRQLF